MSRSLHKLSALTVKSLPPGKYADGGGLWFHRRQDGGGQWILRYTIHGRRREMGLGAVAQVSLKEARESADKWRATLRTDLDPIKERERQRREAARGQHSLADIAAAAFEARKAELKDDGVAGRWFSPLETHILPKLGRVPITEIDQHDIRTALAVIWHAKAATAEKALQRLRICFRHAAALDLPVDLQACDKARALLGQQRHTPEHIVAMPWRDVPAYYQSLTEGTITQLALRLLILTGVRSRPLRFIRLDEISDDGIWTIPGEKQKGRKDKTPEFRVPLSREALVVVEAARPFARNGYLFPDSRQRSVISDMTMSMAMRRAELAARPHGFRSALRDWIEETTSTPHEVAEMMLSHSVGNKVERSYRRTDYLDQRRLLLERWADHVTGQAGNDIIQLLGER